ncbi:MAG: MarR family transcriptional regulator [Ancalomicrobiaceae bacterium]|nr:MarR family transcriptional regulator [Ancalomicrobiaceae bacterium]
MDASRSTMGFLLYDVVRLIRRRFEQRSHHSGLTRSQWQVLACLKAHEGIQQNRLAELIEIKPISLARLLDRMEEQGLVVRRPHPTDRRIHLVYLHPTAGPAMLIMGEVARQTREEALAGLSDDACCGLIANLQQIKANLAAACERPADAPPPPQDQDQSP